MVKKHPKITQKIRLFYRASLFVLLLVAIIFFYFIVVLSNKPRSFDFVDKKIAVYLSSNFDNKIKIRKSYVGITAYGSVKIILKDVETSYQNKAHEERQLSILQAETEFSLLDLILARFYPNDIKIINPEIVIDDLYSSNINQITTGRQAQTELSDYMSAAQIGLAAVRDGKVAIKNFVIENAKILIRNPNNNTEILLKKSDTKIWLRDNILYFSSNSKINIKDGNIDLNSNCKLTIDDFLKCDAELTNLIANSIVNIYPRLRFLDKIDGSFNLVASLNSRRGDLLDANFQLSSALGSFELLDFFSKKIDFKNLVVSGNIDSKTSSLFLSKVSADFDRAKLSMSLLLSNYNDPENQILDFDINLANLPGDDIEKLWPVFLNQNDIRSWVTTHIKGGLVSDAHTKFSLKKDDQHYDLEKLDALVNFSGRNLRYDDYFPEITNIDGVANFTKDNMKIVLSKGDVLNSKLMGGLVTIDDFHTKNIILKINGISDGAAEDLLKYINYKNKFLEQIKKYFNGNAISNFNIKLPIDRDFTLKDVDLNVDSKISNLDNSWAKGDLNVNVKKHASSSDFVSNIDLSKVWLKIDQLAINKDLNDKSALDFIMSYIDKKIQVRNINLWQIQKNKNNREVTSKINAAIIFETSPWLLTKLDVTNNFARNSYRLKYGVNKKNSLQQLELSGKRLDLENLIKNKSFISSKNGDLSNLNLKLNINHILLADDKKIKNLYLNLNCSAKFCYDGFISAVKSDNQPLMNIKISREKDDNFSNITGSITDISLLIRGFNLSDKILAGNTKIDIKNKFINNKSILDGTLRISDGITFYEGSEVKKIYSNQLVSQVKDKIVTNQKISFDQLKLEFVLDDYYILNIKSLIANNYTIGITAKGWLNFEDNSFKINGMIIPGYFINNLFGIGKVPLIGGVVRGLFTGGEGGGLFGIKYEYEKSKDQKEANFKTNKLSAFVPVTIRNLFE